MIENLKNCVYYYIRGNILIGDYMETKKKGIHIITFFVCALILCILTLITFVTIKSIKSKSQNVVEEPSTQIIDLISEEKYTMPKLNLEGDFLNLKTKKEKASISCTINVEENELFKSYASIKVQGTSSLAYDKKNYTITFYKDEENNEKNKIDLGFGWGEQNKYCPKANWIDSTQARNIVTARIAANMQEKYGLFKDTPNNGVIDGYPIEVYANGDYLGLYTINIPKDAWMFNMDEDNENHIVMCAERNVQNSSCTFEKIMENEKDYKEWSIEVGPDSSDEEIKSTYEKLNRVIGFVKDSSDEEFREHFDEYLNLDACLNYLSMIMLNIGTDNVAKNMLLVTYDGKVWYPSLYDLDSTWGLYWNGEKLYSAYDSFDDYEMKSRLWERILTCYKDEFKNRYNELREDVLSSESIIGEFNRFNSYITQDAWDREHEKWTKIPSMKYDLNQIIEYVKNRGEYIDNYVNNL